MALTYKIYPPIGIARLGNSPDDFYIGPEIPEVVVRPEGGYKDEKLRIKRQAARFRIYEYDGTVLKREITDDLADISWSVHLANGKSHFRGGANVVDGGSQTIRGPLQSASFNGKFTYPGYTPKNIPLGEIRTDLQGRLIVLGGFGKSVPAYPGAYSGGLYNREWTDDTSDGSVTASITINGNTHNVLGAWIIVGPPKYAPEIPNSVTLFDRLYDYQRNQVGTNGTTRFPIPATPSFKDDIYPILKSAFLSNYVTGYENFVGEQHGDFDPQDPGFVKLHDKTNPGSTAARLAIFNSLRGSGGMPGNMPYMHDSDSALTQVQMAVATSWKDGNYHDDWSSYSPPSADSTVTPEGLTKAALENCVGGAFSPGIEAGEQLVSNPAIYSTTDKFRLEQTQVQPGQITKDMSVPWQSDFFMCRGGCWWGNRLASYWWPAQRPVKTQVWDGTDYKYQTWARNITGTDDMINNWQNLGFVLKTTVNGKTEYIETESGDKASIMLLTPSINFKDIPSGHSGTVRNTQRAIMLDIINPDSALNFTASLLNGNPRGRSGLSLPKTTFMVSPTAANTSTELLIQVNYLTSATPPTNSSASIKITCTETHQTWDVPITANCVAPKTGGIALVMDVSGSMWERAADGRTKYDNLKAAAKTFVSHMQNGDGIGLITYNHDASVLQQLTTIDATTKQSTINRIQNSLPPAGGGTSIGDGIDKAITMLSNTAYNYVATVVITDGMENNPKFIREVAPAVKGQLYAVGFGEAQNVSASTLQALSNNTGGYFLATGADTSQFRLQKYFLQILSHISSKDVLYDPPGTLHPGTEHRIPFHIADTDVWADITLLGSDNKHADFSLETPSGQKIKSDETDGIEKVEFYEDEDHAYFRIHAAIELDKGRHQWEGDWNAVLSSDVKNNIEYHVMVQSHSDLEFRARVAVRGDADMVRITATLNEFGQTHSRPAKVWGELTTPSGASMHLKLVKDDHGQYSTRYEYHEMGHYDIRLRAAGETSQGTPFHREKHLTFNVTQDVVPGGEDPSQNSADVDNPVVLSSVDEYMVLGKVSSISGESVEGLVVKAFDKDARSKTELGKTTLAADGNYRIPYLEKDYRKTKKEMGGADLMIWIYKGSKILHKEKTQYDSPKVAIIDVKLP